MKKLFLFFLFYVFTIFGNCENLTFAIFSDCHIQNTITTGEKILSRIIESINQDPEIEFAVCLGDIVGYPSSVNHDKYYQALEKYIKITETLKVPLFSIPGNHDLEGGFQNGIIFQNLVGKLYFSYERKNFLMIFLNSEELYGQQIEWLKLELQKSRLNKLIFIHKPLLPACNIPNHTIDIKTKLYLKHLFEQNNVIGIFSGHDHLFYIRQSDKFTQVISGGAGGKLVPSPAGGKNAYHYCIITITENNKILVHPVTIDIN